MENENKEKEFADKAEDFLHETVKKVKESDAFGKFSGFLEKVEEFMEEKSDEFQSGEMTTTVQNAREHLDSHTNDLLSKIKEAGLKIGNQVDDTLDALKGIKPTGKNEQGSGI